MFNLLEHTHRLAAALLNTEMHGIRIDLDYTILLGTELQTKINELETGMRPLVESECSLIELDLYTQELNKRKTLKGKEGVEKPVFNFSSPKQLGKLLFEILGLEGKKTPKGSWSTTAKDLEEISDSHPVVASLTQLHKLQTYNNTFINGILERSLDGRIYPEFNVNGTTTGRISHSNPNMGNMPSRGEWNKIRGIFLPDEGEVIIKADYSQLEVCVAAFYSRDKNLLRIVNDGVSQHDLTAEALKIDRSLAKTLNFAMQYQCGPGKVARILDCSKKDAEAAYNRYWNAYSGQRALIDNMRLFVDAGDPILSIFNRKRRFEAIERKPWDKAYRQAYSALIQGTGGDLMNRAFYLTAEELERKGLGRAGWSVHDEGIVFAKKEHNDEVLDILCKNMLDSGKIVGFDIPLKVEAEGNLVKWKK